jgi:hypothetical protein
MSAYLMVRAEVSAEDRDKFDHWYEVEHLPDACRDFKALGAKRGWSSIDPLVHFAFYEFSDLAAATAVLDSDVMKAMVAEFDRVWQDRVARTRDVLEIAQSI